MELNSLSPAQGARKAKKRIGRGIGSGMGKTSTKGHKGQWARSGGGVKIGFEGGQMPLARRLPKRGFDNAWKKVYTIVNIGDFEVLENGTEVTPQLLLDAGIIRKLEPFGLKVLAGGELTKNLTVKANKFSKSAIEKIEKTGGKTEVL